jgi:hypothetical protein
MSRKKASLKTKAVAGEAAAAEGEAETVAVEADKSKDAANGSESEATTAELIETQGEAIAVEAVFEAEPYDGSSNVDVTELDAIMLDTIETPLADVDEAALEAGIASVFDSILSEGFHVPANDDAGTPQQDSIEAASEDEADPTFALLAELNRLWAQPLAA